MALVKWDSITFNIKDIIAAVTLVFVFGIYHNKVDNLEKETQALRNDQKQVYEKIDRMYELLITKKY